MVLNRTVVNVVMALTCALVCGCSTAPKNENRSDVLDRAASATKWFEQRVSGLNAQLASSAGYIVFPDVGQAGFIVGATYGRGVVYDGKGKQIGWAAINNGSFGLMAGVQGFRMLMVIQNATELAAFKAGKWNGSANGVAVLADGGGSGTAAFQNGLAIYQGANSGLMAGVSVGLNAITYESAGN